MSPKPKPTKPLGCNHKKRYTSVATALDVRRAMGDSRLQIWFCEIHACLHHGHRRLNKAFATWPEACAAAARIHREQRQPRRLAITKTGKADRPWELEWSKQA